MIDLLWYQIISELGVNLAAAALAAAALVPSRYQDQSLEQRAALILFDILIGAVLLIVAFYVRRVGV